MPLNFFNKKKLDETANLTAGIDLPEDQREIFENDINLVAESGRSSSSEQLQKDAEREVINAAEASVKKLHVIKLGRCPVCNEPLFQHMGASVCESCGWHKYDLPRSGKVKVHLHNDIGIVVGERAYVLKTGECLVVHDDVIIARIPSGAYDWVEYVWQQEELAQRRQQMSGKVRVPCAWCNSETDPNKDGFHLVHVAFGASQERYCFCSDECLDAFRKMYPARVHRNCYDRNCNDCNLCVKRYGGEAEEMRMLAKDYIRTTIKK